MFGSSGGFAIELCCSGVGVETGGFDGGEVSDIGVAVGVVGRGLGKSVGIGVGVCFGCSRRRSKFDTGGMFIGFL